MAPKEGYDVLRLIEHGQICYISSEYVEGKILAGWMKTHADIPKEQLFFLIGEVAKQLSQIHKCRKNPCYKYVNPYSIVITEEGEPYFLDMEDSSNEEQQRFMQKRVVRECFLPEEETYYQRASVELDIYGLGKTIQYLLAVSGPDPPLNRREENRFLKIISKCLRYQSKSSYHNVSEIRRQIPKYRQKTNHMDRGRKKLILAAGVVGLCATIWNVRRYGSDLLTGSKAEEEIWLKAAKDMEADNLEPENMEPEDGENGGTTGSKSRGRGGTYVTKETEEIRKSYMELAVRYIADVKDYNKSIECLEKIEEGYAPAGDLMKVAGALLGNREDLEGVEESLKNLEKLGDLDRSGDSLNLDVSGYPNQLKSSNNTDGADEPDGLEDSDGAIPVDDAVRYCLCIIKGYTVLDTAQSAESILSLGKLCLNQAGADGEVGKDIRGCMASAYEKTGRLEDAAHLYEEMLAEETDSGEREGRYRKTAALYGDSGQNEMAVNTCVQGIGELAGAEELMILHIRLLCKDSSIDRNLCAQTIQEYLRRMPGMPEKEEFQKLQREYEIRVEGDGVWVGR